MLIVGIALVVVALAGAFVLRSALKQAPEGYEDEAGFHVTAPAQAEEPKRVPGREAKVAERAAPSVV